MVGGESGGRNLFTAGESLDGSEEAAKAGGGDACAL